MERYRTEVRRAYDKKTAGELSLNLAYPTPTKLRNECLMTFRRRCDAEDKNNLKSFFERPFGEGIERTALREGKNEDSKKVRAYIIKIEEIEDKEEGDLK